MVFESILNHTDISIPLFEETLLSKLTTKVIRIDQVMRNMTRQANEQKESIQSLVTDISHQVKTPMANIMLSAESLSEHALTEEEKVFFCEILQTQTQKLEFLMEGMIKISRMENGHIVTSPRKVIISELLDEATAPLHIRLNEKKIHLCCDYEDCYVYCDGRWTIEALFNILDNAVKYTHPRGAIVITVNRMSQYTRINIKDTGIGIPKNHIQDAFTRFYKGEATDDSNGIGVGLYLSREIITKQGGYITLKSEEGIGT